MRSWLLPVTTGHGVQRVFERSVTGHDVRKMCAIAIAVGEM
ncbi:hypothetical protein STRTUCAR8_04216 [Streptomyces turgidiscabies Car8]|uniref:Uncharacterized protein n=1 Tax=Streptomyces turgidiscabies (strain Car8) TaxID=698760 RepID=L7FC52_STRT8|nr:hypothetical protein STRTUCAR8_04216 [Streptomyces turgidiscabies Car8]